MNQEVIQQIENIIKPITGRFKAQVVITRVGKYYIATIVTNAFKSYSLVDKILKFSKPLDKKLPKATLRKLIRISVFTQSEYKSKQ